MKDLICWTDGIFKNLADVKLSILDFGFIHSDATYDVMKTSNSNIMFFDKHLERYTESCKYFSFTPIEDIQNIVNKLLELNNIKNAFVWICNWRGTPPSGSPRDMSAPEHQIIYVKPYYGIADGTVKLTVYEENKRTPDITIPQRYKNFNWLELTRAQRYADANGCDSAVVLDTNNNISEGPGFGICFVKDGVVKTPAFNCLTSITIQVVEDLCKKNNIKFERTNISSIVADECFICSTSGGITPVSSIDEVVYTHNITSLLINEYDNETNK